MFGVPTYFSHESGFMGPYSALAGVAAIVGAIYGIVPGAVIGLLVGKLEAGKLVGALVGAGVGLIILFLLFASGLDPYLDDEAFVVGLECIPVGAVIGLIVSLINARRDFPAPPPNNPLDGSAGRMFGKLTK
jgi:ABC-type cobalamin transport system permease subunit